MLSQAFYVIINRGIISPVHDREVVYFLNAIEKSFIFQLMLTVKMTGAKVYDTQMVMHTGTCTSDLSFSRKKLKHLSHSTHKHGVICQVKYKKGR